MVLTDEERRTLIAEGYPIPQRFPLSKAEERSLKKIRRKIKNKISAQESRRKKKEYMEELEKKVHLMELKIVELERENRLYKENLAGPQTVESSCMTNDSKLPQPVDSNQMSTTFYSSSDVNERPDELQVKAAANQPNDDNDHANKLEQEVDQSKIEDMHAADASVDLMQIDSHVVGDNQQQQHQQVEAIRSDKSLQFTSGNFTDSIQMQPTQSMASNTTSSINVVSSDQQHQHQRQSFARRKDSTTSVTAANNGQQQQTSTDDDYFIDDILMSQERQDGQQLSTDDDEVDLVANLVGVVCESDDLSAADIGGVDNLHQTPNGRRNSGNLTMTQSSNNGCLNDDTDISAVISSIKVEPQRLVSEPVQSS